MKILVYLNIFLLSFLLVACGDSAAKTNNENEVINNNSSSNDGEGDEKESSNIINCTVTGDRSAVYKIVGEKASIIFMGFDSGKLNMFSVTFDNDEGVQMSTGAMTLDINARGEQMESSLAFLNFNTNGEDWKDEFHAQFYPLYFDTTPDSKDSKTYVTVTEMEKLDDGYMRLKGSFRFNAANSPDPADLPKACLNDALKNAGRKPTYLASLAGTSQISVKGDFNIVFLVKPLGW